MNFVYDLLFIIFSFSLGGITFLFLIFFFITTFMKILSLKCNEIKQRTKLTNPKRKSKYGKMQEIDSELQGYMKLQTIEQSNEGVNSNISWTFGVLKSNYLFNYSSNSKMVLNETICLDECEIKLLNAKNWAASNNGLEISHPERNLLAGNTNSTSFRIYFIKNNELEQWFWALDLASKLCENAEIIEEKQSDVRNYFTNLRELIYKDQKHSTNPFDWINATLPRFWWNIFTNKRFHRFLVRRLGKRIAKITDFPKIIEEMVLHNLVIGPNLPLISNISLVSVTEDGEIDVDVDVEYLGGISLTIKIVASITLPGTFLEVPASALISLNHLKGKLRLHISPPPCERFWAGFHELPDIDVVAETQIGIIDNAQNSIPKIAIPLVKKLRGDVTRVIVNKLKSDIIGDRMVLPHMDDFPIPYFTHHDGENDDDYLDQVILSRNNKNSTNNLLQFSPSRVVLLNTPLVVENDANSTT